MASAAVHALHAAKPGPPASVKAVAGDQGALVSWSPPSSTGGSPVTGYVITATPGGASVQTSAVTSYLVGGLANGTAYTFTVAAVNASGTGPASSPSAAVTPHAPAAPGLARSVKAVAGFEQISVSWTPPKSDGGAPITAYRLVTEPAAKGVSVAGSARSAMLTGLADGTAYRVSVAAVNSAGRAAPAWSTSVTPHVTPPGAPAGVSAAPTAGGGVRVAWTAPLSDGGSPLTAFVVKVAGTGKTITAKPSAASVTVTGLTAGQAYTFTVAARNAKGAGPAVSSAPATAGAAKGAHLVVLSAASLAALTTVGTDGSLTFTSPPPQVTGLAAGDIVAAGVSARTPDGLLADVASVAQSGSTTTLATTPASLDQALKRAGFGASTQLTQGQLAAFTPARPGVRLLPQTRRPASASPGSISLSLNTELYASSNDRTVTVDGQVSLTPQMSFHASITCCFHTTSQFHATDTASASVRFNAEASGSFSGSYTLGTFRFKPITFTVAGFPVVIVPELTVKLNVRGSVDAGLAASAGASITAGVQAATKDSSVSAQPVLTRTAYYNPPSLYGSLAAAAGPEADLSATVDGVAGATLSDQSWLKLAADITKTPWWTLSTQNILSLKLDLALLHRTFASYDKTLSDKTLTLAHAPGPYQAVTITPSPATVTPGGQLQLHAAVAGAAAQNVTWNAPVGNGTITSGGLYTAPATPGVYQVGAAQPASGLNPGAEGLISIRVGDQPPGSPTSPKAVSTSYATATITWKPPADTGGGTITRYTITAEPGGATYPAGGTATSDTISGLAPGATYTFTITATSDGGTSMPSPATSPLVIDNVGGGGETWIADEAPLPTNEKSAALGAGLFSAACPSASACAAVGYYTDSSGNQQGLLETGPQAQPAKWTATEAPLPPNAVNGPDAVVLYSVACPSSTTCAATGIYQGSDTITQDPLVLWRSGSSWTPTELTMPVNNDPKSTEGPRASSVACASTSHCAAIGDYYDTSGNDQGWVASGSGQSWAVTEAPVPTGVPSTADRELSGVACTSTSCVASGFYIDAGVYQGMVDWESNGSWTSTATPLPSDAVSSDGSELDAISCTSQDGCTAIGRYTDTAGYGNTPFLVNGAGGSWKASKAPLPANAAPGSGLLTTVTCPSASACTAIGSYTDSSLTGPSLTGYDRGLLVTGSGTSWTASESPLPSSAPSQSTAGLYAAACVAQSACAAAGQYADSSNVDHGFLVTGSRAAWQATQAPFPANASPQPLQDYAINGFHSVACVTSTQCIVVGSYTDTSGNDQGLLVSGPG